MHKSTRSGCFAAGWSICLQRFHRGRARAGLLALACAMSVASPARADNVATPHITPATGAYASTQTVTISDATAGSTIYFTSDGTLPNNTSNKYTGQLTITSTKTIRAIAYATGLNPSAVATSALTIGNQVATPTFSPEPGPYAGTQVVYISDSTPGATIYFTSDGTTPNTSSVKYSSGLTIASTKTLRAIAYAPGLNPSLVGTAPYTIGNQVATPVLSPDPGPYAGTQTVKISDATPGATIYFTSDGTTPSATSNKYTGVLTISSTKTLKAIAYANGLSPSVVVNAPYTIGNQVATPTFSPDTGAYSGTQSVRILTPTTGATIYYTSDGSTPTAASNRYTVPLTITADKTIKAIAVAAGLGNSAVSTAQYAIGGHVATPTISPAGGTYASTQTVTLYDSTPGATIYFTSDGSTPTTASVKYVAPLTIASNKTINAIAVFSGLTNSTMVSATYTIGTQQVAANPVFSPVAGTYNSPQSVNITDSTAGSSIYYTSDGSTPTTASTQYTGAITVSSSETIRAIAAAPGFSNSAVISATYTISRPGLKPTFYPEPGAYNTNQQVSIFATEDNATIYYTTDGSTPTTASTQYTGPIAVTNCCSDTATKTIKAIEVAPGYMAGGVASATYTIDTYALWIPDYYSEAVHVQVGIGANSEIHNLPTSQFRCSPNAVVVGPGLTFGDTLVYVICSANPYVSPANIDEILVFDGNNIKSSPDPTLYLTTALQTITDPPANNVQDPTDPAYGFSGLIAGAFDAGNNLWVSSINNNTVFVLPRASLNSQSPKIYEALHNTPNAPAGLAFDPSDNSLWIGGNSGGVFNVRQADLYTNGTTFGDGATQQPAYYAGDTYGRPTTPTLNSVEGVAVFNVNGVRTVWVANNSNYAPNPPPNQDTYHEVPGLVVVPFTIATPATIQNGQVAEAGTLTAGTPITGSGSNSIQCPGGLFAGAAHLFINDEGFMDNGPTPYCGDKDSSQATDIDQGSNVGAVINFSAQQLTTPGTILPSQEQLNVTSRPGFGGIYVENDR